jgi:RecA-family ATPase
MQDKRTSFRTQADDDQPKRFDDSFLTSQGFKLEMRHPYVETTGKLLFETLRYYRKTKEGREKQMLCRHKRDGVWWWKAGTDRRVLYRLQNLINADPTEPCHVTEGEKDADRLASLNLLATTVAFGYWEGVDLESLRGRDVYIHEDNNDAGRKKAFEAAAAVHRVARSVRIVRLPGLREGKDVSDWLDAYDNDVELLIESCRAEPPYEPAPGEQEPEVAPLVFVDICAWESAPVPPRDWAVLNRIPLRNVTLLSGHGGLGKSIVAMMLASATVLGRDWLGSMPEPGPVMYYSSEDDADEMHRRLAAIAAHYDASFAQLQRGGLHLVDRTGSEPTLAYAQYGIVKRRRLLDQLHEAALDIKPNTVVIDSLVDAFCGNENDRSQARQFVALMRSFAQTVSCAVLLVAHPSLAGLSSGSGISGTTDWHNGPRGRMYLKTANTKDGAEPDQDLRVLEVMKSNYGPVGERVFVRWKDGVFVPEPKPTSLEQMAADHKIDELFLQLLGRFNGQNRNVSTSKGSTYAPKLFADQPDAGGTRSAAFKAAMERLLAAGKIRNVCEGPPSRRRSRLIIVERAETEHAA